MAETTNELSGRPANVNISLKLLYTTLGIGVLRAALEFQTLAQQASIWFILFIWAVVFGLTWFLIHKIGSRRNWARITFLVMFIAGAPLSIPQLLKSFSATPLSGLIGILQIFGQAVALVMLFHGAANVWFRKPKDR